MSAPGQGTSLATYNFRLLAAVFIVFEILVAAAVVGFLMAPMAQRSADDLAGLMLLSAQTWSELPPVTRSDFELELMQTHMLSLRDTPPVVSESKWHGIYLYFLEDALARKTGRRQHLVREYRDGDAWFWVALPSGERTISVGFPERRVGTQPLRTLAVTLAGGALLAILAALWLARRITRPLARLEAAAAEVGRGEVPDLLPETGPRELAALSQRFNEMARQVRGLLAARTTLLAGISHDLRTPLTRMRLALALLSERPGPAHVARLEKDVEGMDQLIDKTLDLARGLESEQKAAVDLAALVAELSEPVPAGRIQLTMPVPVPPVMVAPIAIRRVLGNLLENALRYGGGEPIEIQLASSAAGVRIGILDRGPGIPDDQLEAVFQPFHRIERSRSTATGGSGLGLAIVRQLAEVNGWRVALSNRPGGGLEAWLVIGDAVPTSPTGN